MKNDIINLLSSDDKRNSYRFSFTSTLINAYLIIIKYLCEINELKLSEVIENNDIYDVVYGTDNIKVSSKDFSIPIHSLLIKYKNNSAKELLIDFLSNYERPIYFHNDNDEVLYLDVLFNSFELYNDKGKSTYITENDANKKVDYYSIFKYFDKILGINNKYLNEDEINYENYKYLYIYNNIPRYRLNRNNNEYTRIKKYILLVDNIILYTTYGKVRNFSDGKIISNYLSKIIMNSNKLETTLLFTNTKKDEISIINYNEKTITKEHLYRIISNNKRQKNVLIKIKHQDLKDNNYRIGFNLYNIEEKDVKDMNKIVSENTHNIELLHAIDNRIQIDIDLLLNK